jgi:hypothetical protein
MLYISLAGTSRIAGFCGIIRARVGFCDRMGLHGVWDEMRLKVMWDGTSLSQQQLCIRSGIGYFDSNSFVS